MVFVDRTDAGRRLAGQLEELRGRDLVVLGLPRGGVPVAFEVARALGAVLDVIFVRKLGVPFQPELAMGAIGEDGVRVLNEDVFLHVQVSAEVLAEVEKRERSELERRARRYRLASPRVPLAGRTAVIVDDGIATGSTARAACKVARASGAVHVVVAVPVAPPAAVAALSHDADEVVCLETPRDLVSVGQWYHDFDQVPESTVLELLQRSAPGGEATGAPRLRPA